MSAWTGVPRHMKDMLLRGLLVVTLPVSAILVLVSPVNTRVAIDDEVVTRDIPLYLKALEFVSRDTRFRLLAGEVTDGLGGDEPKLRAVFKWTRRNVKPQPVGWPVVDDHILNTVIRGYGTDGQMADLCAVLATYAGLPSYWIAVEASGAAQRVSVTLARVDGRWVVLDVRHGLLFVKSNGQLASQEDIVADRGLVEEAAGGIVVDGIPYARYFEKFRLPEVPRALRAEMQMPWPRLWHELTRAEDPHIEIQE